MNDAINLTLKTGREIYMAYNGEKRNKLGQQFNSWLNGIIFQEIYVTPRFPDSDSALQKVESVSE